MAKFIVNNRTEAWKADVNLMIHSCVCSLNYMKISKWAPGNFSVIVTTKVMTILLGTWISGASVVEYFDTSSFEAGQGSPEFTTLGAFLFKRKQEQYKREHHSVYVRCKTVNTCALYRFFFVSSSIVSGGFIVFLCFIFYDATGDRFTPQMSPPSKESRDSWMEPSQGSVHSAL